MEALAGLSLVGIMLMVFVGILWVFMPFAVFGIKDLARELIAEHRSANELQRQANIKLDQIIAQNAKSQA